MNHTKAPTLEKSLLLQTNHHRLIVITAQWSVHVLHMNAHWGLEQLSQCKHTLPPTINSQTDDFTSRQFVLKLHINNKMKEESWETLYNRIFLGFREQWKVENVSTPFNCPKVILYIEGLILSVQLLKKNVNESSNLLECLSFTCHWLLHSDIYSANQCGLHSTCFLVSNSDNSLLFNSSGHNRERTI